MRVLVLLHQFPVRSETFIVNHVAALLDRGHDVAVVPLRANVEVEWNAPAAVGAIVQRTRAETNWAQITAAIARAPRSVGRYAADTTVAGSKGRVPRLHVAARVVRAGPFDVVHAQFASTAASAIGLRRHGLVDAPIVCSVHGQDVNIDIAHRGAALAELAPELSMVTTGTGYMRDVVAAVGVDAAKIRVWPQGVDVAACHPSAGSGGGCHVLSVGRLVEFKGVDDALRVVACARAEVPGLRYTVIGTGPLEDELRQLAIELGVDDITTFAHGQDHDAVLQAHGEADVFLHMGKVGADGAREGQGVAPLEASASAVPVIATKAGGLPEVVRHGETGYVVDIGDVDAAAAALIRLGSDTALRHRLGAAGRRFAEAEYSLNASSARIEALYNELCAGR